ncbi:protein kinase STUNTED isoform X2 [Coffea arabica]|uniref:Protein kinase STUNTED isoform X2 n=1 Tax=Coffea arabica TaxID=13443 RepID=A0A6P6VVE0_COFAR
MKVMGNCSLGNCKCGINYYNDLSGEDGSSEADAGDGGGAVLVVGVKMDTRSKELLTWALVKVAQSGDRVIALHVIDPNTDKATLLSLVKSFDSVLAAYEGFCNLKQVDLKLKVSRGSPIRKVLAREAMSYGAMSLVIGTAETNHPMRSVVSVAKYCAKTVGKDISVMAVYNGKIMFRREATQTHSSGHDLRGSDAMGSRQKRRKTSLSCPPSLVSSTFSCEDSSSPLSSSSALEVDNPMALVPVQTQKVPEPKAGWALLRKAFLHNPKSSALSSVKKSSVMQWILKLPSLQSFAVICPDHEHNVSEKDKLLCSDLDEDKGTTVPFGAHNWLSEHFPASALEIIPKELEGLSEKYSSKCRLFSYQELLSVTSNFSPDNMIGKGGSSRVYRGVLPDGKELAVKILKPSADVLKQFVSEIEIITSLNHPNIISLFGFCFEDNNLLLVYDLLSRGSLEDNLHGTQKKSNTFGWEERCKVALGVAEALEHLHNRTAVPIIHRDVKSSNILLSEDFEPKLSDFGLAMSSSSSSYQINSNDVAGTFGYLAPEYFMHGKVVDKIDVYAYGVVLLELLSGRKPIDNGHPKGPESLVTWAKQILKGGKVADLLDPSLVNAYDDERIEKMVLAASLCIRRGPQFRPNISIVAKLLQGDQETTRWARQQVKGMDEVDVEGQQSSTNIQSFINLALLNLEDHSVSSSSTEQTISVEDYLRGRWSRTSSFDQTLV